MKRRTRLDLHRLLLCLLLVFPLIPALGACSGDGDTTDASGGQNGTTDPAPRPFAGLRDLKGIIHAHSIYSHDACDYQPEGNTQCLMELREALCDTGQEYLLLTDHREMFAEHEFPEVLLYLPDFGDELLYDPAGLPVANRMACGHGTPVIIMAGTENALMPVHLHRHPEGSIEDRMALYGRRDAGAAERFRELGGSVIVPHPEGWAVQDLLDLAPDGVEVFNLHAAIDPTIRPDLGEEPLGFVLDLLGFLTDTAKPDMDLAIVTFWPDLRAWLERWDALLVAGRCYGIAATDAHRNTLPFDLADGDRADSYRRMIQFFGNHLLVREPSPSGIENALAAGRVYVQFDFLGGQEGFDFFATAGDGTVEMGEEVPWSPDLVMRVSVPAVRALDPAGAQPEIRVRLVRVEGQGVQVVAESGKDLAIAVPGPGAYRVEVHITPHHLAPRLGSNAERFIVDYPWLIASPIYVRAGS